MALNTINPKNCVLEKLQKHFDDMQNATMQEMFQVDENRKVSSEME
jgi:glucose-6-phosphate isomerase